jgi:FkbM family methyltransferase
MGTSFRSPAKILRRLKLTSLAARKIASWPRFMCNYALGLVPEMPYEFRNHARIKIGRGVDHVPIIEIFLREDYGAVADGAVILDLGANIGTFSVYAATSARNVTIYAYEPMPDFYRLMQQNILLNELTAVVKCFNACVAGQSGARDLVVDGADVFFPTLVAPADDPTARKISVDCTTLAEILDSNALERIDLLKMDCEGAEYEILYNTPVHYYERIDEIRMEYHDLPDDRHNAAAVADFLRGVGYGQISLSQPRPGTSGNLRARRHD